MNPLLLGHRGARAVRSIPENSLASFELCLEHGCDGFEFDVRLSSDGQAVICHDPSTDGMTIAKTPAKNLSLARLEDVLRQFVNRAFLDIELKVAGLEAQTLELLRKSPPSKGCVISSFLPEVLKSVHDLDPGISLGVLCETQRQLRGWQQSPAMWVIPHFDLVDTEFVEHVHKAGKRIMVWTVNRSGRMRELVDQGVDAIISDETQLLASCLR